LRSGSATLTTGFAITASFAVVEAVVGYWSGSLALLSDAGHMFTDSCALGVAACAAYSAARGERTSRPKPVEIAAALFNSVLMTALIIGVVIEALERLEHPVSIMATPMLAAAIGGLAVNVLVAWIVSRGERTLNSRAALLHVIGDALGSLAAVAAAVVILATGWTPIDAILSLGVAALVAFATVNLLRDTWSATHGHDHGHHHHHHHGHHH
jgi:cobalt-zinc-cadmium efflux system protein